MKMAAFLCYTAVALLLASCNSCNPKVEHLKFFRYNQSSGISSLDPAFAKDQACEWACNQIFNSLVQVDDSLNIKPCIAKSWDISEDGKTYTFHLRTDVFFQNDSCFAASRGRKLVAGDVVYSLGRIISTTIASPGAWIFNNSIDTAQPFTAINDSTFQLKLRRSFPPMLGILSMQYCSVIPVEAVQKYGVMFRSHPVGTGPFMFKNWKEGIALILVKNPNYFEKDSNQQLPYLDGIKITFIDNKKTEYLAFKQHELDFINSVDAAYVDEVLDENGNLKPELNGQFNLLKSPYLNTEYLGFNTSSQSGKDNPFLDKRLRQAINYGFNKREMLKYLRRGLGKPAESGFTPFGLPSFDSAQVKGYTYDIAQARQLLKEAGHENGKGLPELSLYTNETYKEYALFISKQLEQLGIKLKVEIAQPAILREWMSQGKVLFFRGSWLADYPDAENYFAVFYSKNGAPPNYTRFNNAEYDALYEKALTENDNTKRYNLYHQMDRLIIAEAPVVPLYYDEILRFSQKNVEGLNTNASNLLGLKRVRIK
jgi:oligopeptide transport system substrate-binding protein